ncbi:MAG TPA: hypothetical protein VGU43_04570 [Thermoplasmata archaeon]|nr:hypothetical protein [Thermoplasmata archaeon]
MSDGDIHPEIELPPWEREDVYKVPVVRGGRPDLPGIEQEQEALLRLIGTLPKDLAWWPGHGNALQVAYEVRARLLPRINVITLGRWQEDAYIWFFLLGPGPKDYRCATLCIPHPTDAAWLSGKIPRELLYRGERNRNLLSKHVMEASARAMREEQARHWVLAPELSSDRDR